MELLNDSWTLLTDNMLFHTVCDQVFFMIKMSVIGFAFASIADKYYRRNEHWYKDQVSKYV